jgi:hypothetical protein
MQGGKVGGIIAFYTPIICLVLGLLATIYYTIIPYEVEDMNVSSLNAIVLLNTIMAVVILVYIYIYESIFKDNIIQLSIFFTFLIALPITLTNIGMLSIMFSNN